MLKAGDKVIAKGQSMVIVEIITCRDGETRYKTQQGYTWSANELTLEETFKVGDVVYISEYGQDSQTYIIVGFENMAIIKNNRGGQKLEALSNLTHKKPLTKITKEQLADMGYEVK